MKCFIRYSILTITCALTCLSIAQAETTELKTKVTQFAEFKDNPTLGNTLEDITVNVNFDICVEQGTRTDLHFMANNIDITVKSFVKLPHLKAFYEVNSQYHMVPLDLIYQTANEFVYKGRLYGTLFFSWLNESSLIGPAHHIMITSETLLSTLQDSGSYRSTLPDWYKTINLTVQSLPRYSDPDFFSHNCEAPTYK